jgi:hypothetical protein
MVQGCCMSQCSGTFLANVWEGSTRWTLHNTTITHPTVAARYPTQLRRLVSVYRSDHSFHMVPLRVFCTRLCVAALAHLVTPLE